MFINDIKGQRIEVINLEKAISQASSFVGIKHEDASFAKLDDELTFYWKDILNKLNELKK